MSVHMVRLEELVEIRGGGTPSKDVPEYWNGPIPWASVKDFKSTEIARTIDTITDAGVVNSATNLIPTGNILVPTRMAVGKAAVNIVPMAINQDLKALFPAPHVDVRYLLYALLANGKALERMATGATVKGITLDVLRRLEIPLPPLDEQKRIAAILDKADQLRQKRRQAIALLDNLTQSIFQEMFGDGANNWESVELKDAVKRGTIVTYGIVQAGDEFEGGVPYIRTGDIQDGEISQVGLRHTAPEIAAKFARSRVEAGEIVMSIRATVGTTAIVPDELDGVNLTQGTARIAPGADFTPEYFLYYLRSTPVQNWIQGQVKGATFREITLSRLRELSVTVPPIQLQIAFSNAILKLKAGRMKAAEAHMKADSLFSSLQHRAFSGQL